MGYRIWIKAARLPTLLLALSSVYTGNCLAIVHGRWSCSIFILTLCTASFLQLLANFANDYGDAQKGADIVRIGPPRMLQQGLIKQSAMQRAILLCCMIIFLSGGCLLYIAFDYAWWYILFFVLLGGLAIIAAITYTMGKKPYGYRGLGDIAVFFFFGFVGVLGSHYIQVQQFFWLDVLPAASCGLFSTSVLNINNIRDIDTDCTVQKKTIPVRIGKKKAIYYHWLLLSGGLLTAYGFLLLQPVITLLHYICFIMGLFFIYHGQAIYMQPVTKYNKLLSQMVVGTLVFMGLLGVGVL